MLAKKTIALVVALFFATIALPMVSFAAEMMSKDAKIARAMEAAPDFIGKSATIVDTDGTLLREGTNGWTCMPAMPGGAYPMCNDEVWSKLLKTFGSKDVYKPERVGISYMLAGDDNVNNNDPFDTKPDPGEVWVQEGPHLMILVPDSKALEGLPSDPNVGGPYVMWKGTPYAHIMVPVGPRNN